VTSVIGLALLVFGMAVNSPTPVRVTALGLGPITIVTGLLLPRIQGPLELSPTGLKGQLDPVPTALVFAHQGAKNVLPEGEPDREERAKEAAIRAVLDSSSWHKLSHLQLQGASLRETPWRPLYVDLNALGDLLPRDLRTHPNPDDEPPDEPPLAAKRS
jgi:hypothetical protein